MTRKPFLALRLACLLALSALGLGCATTRSEPWLENGSRKGTLYKDNSTFGSHWRYVDTGGRLQRAEDRDEADSLLPGAAVIDYTYDAQGNLAEEAHRNASGASVSCPLGYAFKQYAYQYDAGRNTVVVTSCLDSQRRPVLNSFGYACQKEVHDGASPTIKEVILEDAQNKPAQARYDDIAGVSRITYTVLDGIGSVRCGVYYGPTGEVVGRKQLSGQCSYYNSTTTTTYR